MSAPIGNTNAEKWTLKESQIFIDSVYEYVLEHKDCCSIEEACCELEQYEKLLIYLENKFDKIVFNAIKKSKAIIKQRILKQGLKNKYNPTMAIFVLKNNHDMKDKQEIDQTIIEKPDLSNLTYEQLLKLRDGNSDSD
jgi:hypothetical protein